MKRLSLTQRLSLVFAVLLLACSGISLLFQIRAEARHEQEVVQQLSSGLAAHIAGTAQLMDAGGWKPDAVRDLFDKLMAVNPAVELYLLDPDGRIVGHAAPPGHLLRDHVDLAPVRRLIGGAELPCSATIPGARTRARSSTPPRFASTARRPATSMSSCRARRATRWRPGSPVIRCGA